MRQRGFTIVELVVVIALLGIISIVTVGFITSTVQGQADIQRRDQLSSSARGAVERIAREVRNALPNSVRVSGACLEFIPALAASRYESVPLTVAAASNAFPSVPFAVEPTGGYIAVYPIDTNRADGSTAANPIYDLDGWSIISPLMASSTLRAASGAVSVRLTANHAFPADSPSQRYFIVDQPVSFCVDGTDLYRYANYGFQTTQLDTSSSTFSNMSEPSKRLLAGGIEGATVTPFSYQGATLARKGVVLIDLFVQDQVLTAADPVQESIRVQFEVQVKNVP